jgi:hypothetical protein
MTPYRSRQGTILIIVAGISALLASLTVSFLMRMRADAEEMDVTVRESQARIMLMAACNYIQEASRIGWERPPELTGIDPDNPTEAQLRQMERERETFGWIDVRDGKLGPKFYADGRDSDVFFPVGTAARFPMYVMEAPPYATELTAAYNPIRTPVSPEPLPLSDGNFGRPYLRYPDPQPQGRSNLWSPSVPTGVTVLRDNFPAWRLGPPTPRLTSTGRSWFRIYRDGPATFVVTCGAGGSEGHRSWSEVPAADKARFGEESVFNTILASEIRLWYRVEWSAAVMAMDYHMLDHSLGRDRDHYMVWPINASHSTAGHEYRTQTHARNMGGTIRWVQRLLTEPTNW